MSCDEWKEHLISTLYGEVDPAVELRLRAHLTDCPTCRQELEELEEARRLLRSASPPVPAAPRVVVLAPPATSRSFWVMAASLGAVALLVGFSLRTAWQAERLIPLAGGSGPVSASPAAPAIAKGRDELDRWLDERWAGLEKRLGEQRHHLSEAPSPEAVTRQELEAVLARLEKKMDRGRAADIQYVLDEITAAELRTGMRLGETQQALHYLALANDPRISEQ